MLRFLAASTAHDEHRGDALESLPFDWTSVPAQQHTRRSVPRWPPLCPSHEPEN